jgi:accessory gene regulator B
LAAANISNRNKYTKDEEEQVEYALRIVIFEVLKLVGIIIILCLIGYPIQTIIAIAAMTMSKPFIGGYHEDSQIRCFIATLMVIGGIVYLSTNVSLDLVTKLVLSLVSLYCIYQQAPVVNPKMAITRAELIKRNRTVGVTIIIALIIVSIVFNKSDNISNTITWTVVFQALLMFNKRNA